MQNDQAVIEIITKLLNLLRVTISTVTCEVDEKTHSKRFVITTTESALLIGEHGARLLALNHLVKKMAEHTVQQEGLNFMVDVNDYHKKHIEDLRAKAHILAERARYFKSSVEMEPLSSYERMIIHSEFSNTPDIVTESAGTGKDRHIVIKFSDTKTLA